MNSLPVESSLAGGQATLAARSHHSPETSLNKAMLGLLIFLGTEAMFFAGLISTFLILRAAGGIWPPVDQPRLPVDVTAINSLFLLASALTMHRAVAAAREDRQKALVSWLGATGGLGLIFLALQGREWIQLIRHGLTLTSSNYGATFYTLIGCHGLHVFAAVVVLTVVFARARQRRYRPDHLQGLELCRVYWFFVVALWPVLYGLVYLG
ncbi:MAG: heme-copper oxidase subunit III [candidate division KSB1 bacterium]|nr:heme-copper oxidase subunit III [candidate division KSB1 bacterium]MDZ7274267.1 heme-copper oxidase subunit III [candidate division KSB1 bacterium]MDZ7287211.1 heme-copper oxidase subunit III [candidate division KSB1 bacterium]MDZ7296864.1 heme-copper oxidase subunit III [candidate division KSB1 bacterium]MDZ7306031.1 heme-copper oxidase subunit III [candidate division KSB1 bacterium]